MRPGYIALVFWALSACAVFGILKSLRTGVATDTFTYRQDQNPGMFMMSFWAECSSSHLRLRKLCTHSPNGDPIAALQSSCRFISSSVHQPLGSVYSATIARLIRSHISSTVGSPGRAS